MKGKIFTKAEWARWNVRDGEMQIIDAINYASFMRSSIAAHKSDHKMIRVLSIYDVANVQFLARRLILERMDFRRFGERTAARRQGRVTRERSFNQKEGSASR